MLRQFLTVLALISGFAALAEPAQAARIASEIAATSQAEQGPSCAISRSGLVAGGMGSEFERADAHRFCPRPADTAVVPTVQIKVDRARE